MVTLSYTDLAYFDDLLSDCLIEKVLYWATIRKVRNYKPIRGISESCVVQLLQDIITRSEKPSISDAVNHFLSLNSIQIFMSRFQNPSIRAEFKNHCKRYMQIYSTDCGFSVEVTDRYLQRSNQLEACVVARKTHQVGEEIKFLTGYLAELDDDDEEELNQGRDFSIINSSRRGRNCLMLGPARFVNHDCQANSRFVSHGMNMSIHAQRPISIGEEITVEYSKNYFGKKNIECLCVSCEFACRNGFAKPQINGLSVDLHSGLPDDSDVEEIPVRRPSPPNFGLETPPASTEPEILTSSESSPLRSLTSTPDLFSPEPEKRTLRPRKGAATFLDYISNIGHLNDKISAKTQWRDSLKLYFSSPFKAPPDIDDDDSKRKIIEVELECLNCSAPYIARLKKTRRLRSFCPRCHRHAILYNAHWPSTRGLNEDIEMERTPEDVDKYFELVGSHNDLETIETNSRSFSPSTTSSSAPRVTTSRSKRSKWFLQRYMPDINVNAEPKRKRGRPRRHPLPLALPDSPASSSPDIIDLTGENDTRPKKRGRKKGTKNSVKKVSLKPEHPMRSSTRIKEKILLKKAPRTPRKRVPSLKLLESYM